jgi:hypothetical protein
MASADLPLAVGPAISTARFSKGMGGWTPLSFS